MADASAYAENIKKYANGGYNQAAAEKIVGHLGIALGGALKSPHHCTCTHA